jgi:hypothetical protein
MDDVGGSDPAPVDYGLHGGNRSSIADRVGTNRQLELVRLKGFQVNGDDLAMSIGNGDGARSGPGRLALHLNRRTRTSWKPTALVDPADEDARTISRPRRTPAACQHHHRDR